jgi:hypothetical protein
MGAWGASLTLLPLVSETEDRIPQGIQRLVVRVCTVRSDEEMDVEGNRR